MKLYEIPAEYQSIIDATEESEGVLSPEQEHQLSALEGEFAEKADNICKIITNIDAENASIAAEVARLATMKRTKVNQIKRLKEYLKANMQAMNLQKMETPSGLFKPRIQANPTSIEWTGEALDIPFIYRKPPEVDSTKVKAAYKAGQLIEGDSGGYWNIIKGKTHLRLK